MQVLCWSPRFAVAVNRSCRKTSNFRAFSSDSSNQSRGSLPRFFSNVLPPSKGSAVRVQGDEFWHKVEHRRQVIPKIQTTLLPIQFILTDMIELFNGKGGLVKGFIERVDRTGADVVALENPKLISTNTTQLWVIHPRDVAEILKWINVKK